MHVYTTGNAAELFLNGKSLGRKIKGPFQYRLRWDSVKYEPGELKVITYKNSKQWATVSKKTTGVAVRIQLLMETKIKRKDLAFITVQLLDKEGLLVPTADNLVRFKLSGPGKITAVGNGDPTNYDSFQSNMYKAFLGQCLLIVQSTERNGTIRISAESDSLKSGGIQISL